MTTNPAIPKMKIRAEYIAQIKNAAYNELIARIADITGDIAIDIVSENFPDMIDEFEKNEEFLMDREDFISGILVQMLLTTIEREF